MEQIFAGLHGVQGWGHWVDRNIDGIIPDYFSLELISNDELIIPLHFYRLTMYARRKYWNGAGSDNTPAFMRYIFTKLLRMIPCTIWIHDISVRAKRMGFMDYR